MGRALIMPASTQLQVENLLRSEGTSREALGREAFEARVWEWKHKYGGQITNQLRRLGASCDWERERFTLDEGLSKAVREAFIRLYEDGLIYQGPRMINWSPGLQTAVSDLEVGIQKNRANFITSNICSRMFQNCCQSLQPRKRSRDTGSSASGR